MNVRQILDRLVSFPSVVGESNRDIAGWIADFLSERGCAVTLLDGPEGDRVNLFATLGPAEQRGYILSGHMDVVPAGPGWGSDPFKLVARDNRLIGRGACDMKGFLAAALSCVDDLRGKKLNAPIHFAFSYDEEAGCRGAPHMIAELPRLCAPPLGVIVGEPSGMRPVLAHKGKAACRISVHGKAGHSSQPAMGLNAIHALAEVLHVAVAQSHALQEAQRDPRFDPPCSTLQVGLIKGGAAVNIIPEFASMDLEVRAIAGVDPLDLFKPIEASFARLQAQGFRVERELLSSYPGMSLAPEAPLAKAISNLTGSAPISAVSYGTEAGLFQQAGYDAIVCGPGDIDRAHKPNEWIAHDELEKCRAMIIALATLN